MAASEKAVSLKFWVMANAGFSTRGIFAREIREFRKTHPHIDVTLAIHPWSRAWDRLMDVAKERPGVEAPDILQVGTTWMPTLAFLGMLSPFPDGVKGLDREAFLPRAWDSCKIAGDERFCAVPWMLDVRVLYFRRDILAEVGLDEKSLTDWEGFSVACKRFLDLHRGNGRTVYPLSLSSQKPGVQVHDIAPWAWAAGGELYNPLERISLLTTPETTEGLSMFFGLVHKGIVPLFGRDAVVPMGSVFTGDYAMQFCGAWPVGSALNPSHPDYVPRVAKNLGVAPFPMGPKGRYTFIGGSNLCVSSRSAHPHEAWEFVRFLSGRESQTRTACSVSAVPARKDSMEDVFARHPDAKRVFAESLGFARALPPAIPLGSIERAFWHFGESVLALIQDSRFDGPSFRSEIERTDRELNTILSLYRHGRVGRST